MAEPSSSLSRRSFLRSSGLSLAATTLPLSAVEAEAAPAPEHAAEPVAAVAGQPASPVTLVNILQGVDSTYAFSRGGTLPIAALPFGMAHWTLQNNLASPWFFAPRERRIHGFRCTHQLSPWLNDYGQATFLPVCGTVRPDPVSRGTSYRPEEASLLPHRMRMHLLRYGIDAELVPTERCCVLTADYTKAEDPGFLFDVPGDTMPAVQQDKANRTVSFTSTANHGGVPPGFANYYVLQFSEPWTSYDLQQTKEHAVGTLRFAPAVRHVEVRIGTSFISFEQAALNLEQEVGTSTPQQLRTKAETVWNDSLNRIRIEGATGEEQRTFYSCLYRTLLFPRMWHEPDGRGGMHHRSPYTGEVVPGVMYADHGYWDVYRAWYPMMTILFPERLGEILQAWVNAYKEGGWLPKFPCPGYKAAMTGSLIDSAFGEAAVKGIGGFDLATAYDALKKHATQPGKPDAGYGRKGLEEYVKYGYVPADLVKQSAAETVDSAYGDYCIAQVANKLGHADDAAMLLKRSHSWRALFDRHTGFLRGKKSDGTWVEPFDPVRWGDPYVEGAAWQHRWDAPHQIHDLIAMLGGRDQALAALQQMLTVPPDFNVGAYGSEIHEISEMAAVNFGQYSHNNQPVHHVLAIFVELGRPDLAAHYSLRVVRELYTPDAFAGDEDTGSMAAWYILAALGILVLCPAQPEYKLSHPAFPAATVQLPGGRTLRVRGSGEPGRRVSLNGKPLAHFAVSHADLVAGGELLFG